MSAASKQGQSAIISNAVRAFSAAKLKVVTEEKDSVEESQEKDGGKRLKFVESTPNLRQVFVREPNDGLFPKQKTISELTAEDVPQLIKKN
jgi:hypothetical protein